MQWQAEHTPEQPTRTPRWHETDPAQRHLVVVGFKGSYYDPIGGLASHYLGRPPLDTMSHPDTIRAWMTEGSRKASMLELAESVRLLKLPPQVVFMRAATFARKRAQALLAAANCYMAFVDTPPAICERRLRHVEYGFHPLERASAIADLNKYDVIASRARACAHLVFAGTELLEQPGGIEQAARTIVVDYQSHITPTPRSVF